MKKLYLDTGALVKLYIVEEGSEWVQQQAGSSELLPLNPLQGTEFRNAVLASCGRGIISETAMRQTFTHFDQDIREGFFTMEMPDWAVLWQRTTELALQHTPSLLCRTLDILHVALAESCGSDAILTGDKRQAALCEKVGLSVIRIRDGNGN